MSTQLDQQLRAHFSVQRCSPTLASTLLQIGDRKRQRETTRGGAHLAEQIASEYQSAANEAKRIYRRQIADMLLGFVGVSLAIGLMLRPAHWGFAYDIWQIPAAAWVMIPLSMSAFVLVCKEYRGNQTTRLT